MPTFPPKARKSWGDEIADEVATYVTDSVQEAVRKHAVPRDEYREVLSRLDVVESRLDGIDKRMDRMEARFEKRFDKIDERFNKIDERFDKVHKRFDTINGRFDQMHDAMRVQTRWAIGILALFGTMTTALMAVAVFSG